MSAVPRLSLRCPESLQQLLVKSQHNQRIVSEQTKGKALWCFYSGSQSVNGGKGNPWGDVLPWKQAVPARGGGGPALTRGRRMPKNHCLFARRAGMPPHCCISPPVPSHGMERFFGENTRKCRDSALPAPQGLLVTAKTELCSAQGSPVWEDNTINY